MKHRYSRLQTARNRFVLLFELHIYWRADDVDILVQFFQKIWEVIYFSIKSISTFSDLDLMCW
jgi:hypothetical protein